LRALSPSLQRSLLGLGLLLGPMVSGIAPTASLARTWTVALDGSGDFTHPQPAIQACTNGDSVVVYPGHYVGRVSFAGKRIVLRSSAGPATTTIDANGIGSVVTIAFGQTAETVVDGFTLTGGAGTPFSIAPEGEPEFDSDGDADADAARIRSGEGNGGSGESRATGNAGGDAPATAGGGGETRGGALFLYEASPTVRNLLVRGNHANIGGGVWVWGGAPVIEDCVIRENFAGSGGGIAHEGGGGATWRRARVEANQAATGGAARIYLAQGRFFDCHFEGNDASEGGALYIVESTETPLVSNCVFVRNRAGEGSAVSAQFGSLRMENSTLAYNGPRWGDIATVLARNAGSYSVERTVFFRNIAATTIGCVNATVSASCCLFWPEAPPACALLEDAIHLPPGFCGRNDFRVTPRSFCLPQNSPHGCGRLGADLGVCGTPSVDIAVDELPLDAAPVEFSR